MLSAEFNILEDNKVWIDTFRKVHGRSPRILHIGNICNNAYNIARLLNEAGMDCDVVCYDYYHIQGCPEWEDADFEGEIHDQFNPDWTAVDLKGYNRPKWFVQGPIDLCLEYLIAKRMGDEKNQERYWKKLGYLNKTIKDDWKIKFTNILSTSYKNLVHCIFILVNTRNILGSLVDRFMQLNTGRIPIGDFAAISLFLLLFPIVMILRLFKVKGGVINKPEKVHDDNNTYFDERVEKLIKAYRSSFGDRQDELTKEDFVGYDAYIGQWRKVIGFYDIVQAYATTPVIAMLVDSKPYVAYEHGTVRDIPFERDSRGRLTLLSYHLANIIHMTNADSIPQASYIQQDKSRIIYGLHGFDERRIYKRCVGEDGSLDCLGMCGIGRDVKLFLSPARQHWKNGFMSWLKGNDRVIRAVALLTEKYSGRFKVLFAEWGQEVDLSKQLITELDVEEYFIWIPTLSKKMLWRAYGMVDCVIDQFIMPCLGGIAMEALAVAHAPVITSVDDEVMREFFGETIPVFNCSTVEEIASAMEAVINDSQTCAVKAKEGKEWIKRFHSHEIVINKNIEAYRRIGSGFSV